MHGYPRTTGDLDVWVKPDKENYNKLVRAYKQFGLPLHDMTEDKFLNTERYDVFTYGVPPVAIDIMTKCKGLVFNQAYKNSKNVNVGNLKIRLIHLNDLLIAKKFSNRPKDLDDIQKLKS